MKRKTAYCQETGKRLKFTHHKIEITTLWPNPAGWKKTSKNPNWRFCHPSIAIPAIIDIEYEIKRLSSNPIFVDDQYLLPLETPAEKKRRLTGIQTLKWYSNIPENIRSAIKPFSNRQFYLLLFIRQYGAAALDLISNNPALSYMLAANRLFRPHNVKAPLKSARFLLRPRKNQKDILNWLMFPPTNQVRNILRSILPGAINDPALRNLRQRLWNQPAVLKTLSHLKKINAGVLRIVNDDDLFECVSEKFIEEVSLLRTDDTYHYTAYLLQNMLNAFRLINLEKKRYPIIGSFSQLLEIQEDLDEKIYKFLNPKKDLSFPIPPIAGTDAIVPITSVQDLISEGYHQRNCAANYIEHVAIQQNHYIYSILTPERCTLSLKKKDNGWGIDELEKAGNQPVSAFTEKAITHWIDSHNVKTLYRKISDGLSSSVL